MRGLLRRRRPRRAPAPPTFERFQAEVEPALTAVPRVHRFAQVPVLGEPGLRGEPVAVCIEPGGDEARTRASLERQTVAPAAVLRGTPAMALGESRAGLVAFVRGGDVLAPLAIERLGQAAALAPDAALLTTDEDALDPAGRRVDPVLRPGPSPDLLPDAPWLAGALVAVRREPALARDERRELGWRHALALALGGTDGGGLAHVPMLLVHTDGPARETPAAARPAPATASPGAEPVVEAIVLLRDRPELLRRCARSVLDRSSYERLRLRLVDNGSTDPELAPLLAELARDERVTVTRDDAPFNFAALNNRAAAASDAGVVIFLNNDTEVVTPDWIEGLLLHAARPEVGAAAPLLTYPDGSVQHAGAALGLHGYAGHPFAGLRPGTQTPFGTARGGTRNWLAVTAACLMVERRKLDAVGGFDESFVVAGNDVDLCLRLTAAGHRSLCATAVELLHDESRSRGTYIDPGDFARSETSYGAFRTVGDPFYNPNLTLRATTCGIRGPGEEV